MAEQPRLGSDGRLAVVVPLRMVDFDAAGHVHHSRHVVYCEEARHRWHLAVDALAHSDLATAHVVARIEVDYRRPILVGTHQLTVEVTPVELGRSSYTLAFTLRLVDEVVATARSVQVHLDHATRRPRPLPPAVRELWARWPLVQAT